MWSERACEQTGNVMPVSAGNMNSLRATSALQAEPLDSFCTYWISGMLACQSARAAPCCEITDVLPSQLIEQQGTPR